MKIFYGNVSVLEITNEMIMHQRKIIFVKLKVSTNRFERNSREIKFNSVKYNYADLDLYYVGLIATLFICNC